MYHWGVILSAESMIAAESWDAVKVSGVNCVSYCLQSRVFVSQLQAEEGTVHFR